MSAAERRCGPPRSVISLLISCKMSAACLLGPFIADVYPHTKNLTRYVVRVPETMKQTRLSVVLKVHDATEEEHCSVDSVMLACFFVRKLSLKVTRYIRSVPRCGQPSHLSSHSKLLAPSAS